jgi:RNA polymerase sigma factor (sigma-70 family)
VLAKHFSLRNLDLAEDVVQATLMDALRVWRTHGVPDNPTAWVRRVAKNKLLDVLRHDRMATSHANRIGKNELSMETIDDSFLDSEIADSQLRMMFVCCSPQLADEDRIAMALKTLCGFGTEEIARALLITSEAAKKRLQRAKAQLAEADVSLELPDPAELERRLAGVYRILYLLFNEGYLSTSNDDSIRRELCEEAIRLTTLLADHPRYSRPSSDALLALMLFHAARFDSRIDEAGRIVLLGDQDRTTWDQEMIELATARLDRSARGTVISRYHLEAGIAYEHCRATSLAATNWDAVIQLYDALIGAGVTAVLQLNRVIAIAQRDGPTAGLKAIRDDSLESTLVRHHLLHATVGELHRRCGNLVFAAEAIDRALACSPSPAERQILMTKRQALQQATS